MGDAASGHSAGAGQHRGRQGSAGSSVLTPPTGIPAIPDLEPDLDTVLPTQRQASPPAPAATPPVPADTPPPPAQRTVVDPCVCGHGPGAHEHYRPGTDCGACGRRACGEYRPENTRWRRLLRGVGLLG